MRRVTFVTCSCLGTSWTDDRMGSEGMQGSRDRGPFQKSTEGIVRHDQDEERKRPTCHVDKNCKAVLLLYSSHNHPHGHWQHAAGLGASYLSTVRRFINTASNLHRQKNDLKITFFLGCSMMRFKKPMSPSIVMGSTFHDIVLSFAPFSLHVKNLRGVLPFLVGKAWQESNKVPER